MFKQIKKIDTSNGNVVGLALICLALVVSVSQEPNHYSNKLFDENQKLVSQDLDAPWFKISTSEGLTFVVDENEYNELKNALPNFTEITKVNERDEEGKALINLECVKAIVEQQQVPSGVDENGNITYKPTQYAILRSDGRTFFIYEKEYQRLVDILTRAKHSK